MSEAGRVIAGSARATHLLAPGEGTRPLADRVKQTLFAILDPDLRDAAVLDLFAGSGAGGIEALSRGAARAVFVEKDQTAVAVIGQNLVKTHLAARGEVVRADVPAYLSGRAAEQGPFDIVLIDPPYAETELLARTLHLVGAPATPAGRQLLSPEAWVVVKHFWRNPPPAAEGLLGSVRAKRFGETALTFYRLAEPSPAESKEAGR
jgi:16S rRNA (guanine(966)-N(2))-methyltransferase RsmD